MAVVEDIQLVSNLDWTNVTPDFAGPTVTLISNADANEKVVFRAGFAASPPPSTEMAGQPLRPGEGFEKKALADLTYQANPDALFVRSRGSSAQIWVGFEDTN